MRKEYICFHETAPEADMEILKNQTENQVFYDDCFFIDFIIHIFGSLDGEILLV